MTPEEVLSVLRVCYLPIRDAGWAPAEADIQFTTTVQRLIEDFDLVDVRCLGAAFNHMFDIDVPSSFWNQTLRPKQQRTLRQVCELIASRATVAVVGEVRILGAACRKAGAFLVIRELLKGAGADVSGLRPSMPLAHYAERQLPRIRTEIVKLAPKAAGVMRCRWRCDAPYLLSAAVLLLASIIGALLAFVRPDVGIPWFVSCFGAMLGIWKWSVINQRHPKRLGFEGLHNFRDLAALVAGEWWPEFGPKCLRCGYRLCGSKHRCPECGRPFTPDEFGLRDADLELAMRRTRRGSSA
jgi:hypothetical protein